MRLSTPDLWNAAMLVTLLGLAVMVAAESPHSSRTPKLAKAVDTLGLWLVVAGMIFGLVYLWRLV